MRRFIFLVGVVLLVFLIFGIASGAALAKTGPFLPGSLFFPIQNFSEQIQARLQSSSERQMEIYLVLLERRIVNLTTQVGTIHESESLAYLNTALDQAVLSWSQLPEDAAASLREQMIFLLKASEITAGQLTVAPTQNPGQVAAFLAKITTLQTLAAASESDPAILASLAEGGILSSPEEVFEKVNLPDATIDPLAVPFPAGSVASKHAFFSLTGQHAQIDCEACHSDGVYEGTATYCEDCHAGVKPDPHYTGDCAACHSPFSWRDITFDHTLVATSECVNCHQADKPANHFGNQCAACHSTITWDGARFNHQAAGAIDCQSCHIDDKPTNHFNGQCSACHTTNSWPGASFNHQVAGAADCQSCHIDDKPVNHFNGQCSACHTTNSWPGASFNHQAAGAADCQSCHVDDKPANHFNGQCSVCHSTNTWDGANFSHAGQTDCKSCHASDKPAGHFNGQCSSCHATNDWDAEFSHSGQTDCKSCHAGDRPGDHNNGQCSQCHNTSDWDDADDDDDGDDDDGGDDGGDDDGDDGDADNQNSNLDSTPFTVAAGFHSYRDCATCHQPNQAAFETPQPNSSTSLLQVVLTIFQKMVLFSIG